MDMSLIYDSSAFLASADFQKGAAAVHIIIVSVSVPRASVRAVNQSQGVLWELDCRSRPDLLSPEFNPCSVSSSVSGNIFILDRGTEKVRKWE